MKTKLQPLFLFLFVLMPFSWSIAGGEIIGSRASSLGNASVTLTDLWSIQNNQAGIASISGFTAGINIENRYLMKELSLKSAALVAPTRFGNLGLSFNQFGYSLYNENKIGLAYARSFGKSLRIGVQLDYFTTNVADGYKGGNVLTFELGIQTDLTENLSIGAYIFNPVRAKNKTFGGETAPMIMRTGFGYRFTDAFKGLIELEKNFETKASFRMGFEYYIHQKFAIRTGVSSFPVLYSVGACFMAGRFEFNVSGSMHERLGVSTQGGISFHLKSKTTDDH